MRRPRRDYTPGVPPPRWARYRWRVLFKPKIVVIVGLALVLLTGGVFALAAAMGGRYVDAHIAAIEVEANECTLTWQGHPGASSTSTMPCPPGAELGAPVRVYADELGQVSADRPQAIGLAWFLMACPLGMTGVVAFALATPDSDRWDGSIWDLFSEGD